MISNPEIISLALIGATTKAAQLRASNTQPDALTRLEQSVIPELSVLSLTDATAITSEQPVISEPEPEPEPKKKKKKRSKITRHR